MLTKDQIFNAKDIDIKELEIPEWGGSIFVKEMSVGEIELYQRYAMKMEDAAEPNVVAFLVSLVACDEKGKRIFEGQEDVVRLGMKSARILSRIAAAATEMNALGEDAVEEESKNS
jgi:hypothetical protein